ncbi:hypothetical protein GCM10023206_05160 [Acinetobacter puyangensis]|uniref:Dimethylamine monooxygenase subunit DmmA-like C-terminal domain-containing protein n=1 Tax=Acinetobacter puyangensis TaxID=1096779 RepID=A0A240EBJ3_9GAMM|nr:dimethylamine monooxygenase subunit DmmA family protein [Acinetobacter puyangensis]SNX45901.1 hypothetical protein SAMN05421731_106136 [Acinetobacter puyangensis]
MQQAMSSTPLYATVTDDMPRASEYLIIVQDQHTPNAQQLCQKCQQLEQAVILSAHDDPSLAALFHAIAANLTDAHIGIHALVYGDEYFLWQVAQQLSVHGLLKDEIQLIKNESLNKRIYCVHCFHLFQSTADEFCDCPQCATHLFIRSHFSERLGAYMAVCANAEEIQGETA